MKGIVNIFFMLLLITGHSLQGAIILKASPLPDLVEYVLNCFAEGQKDKQLILVEKIYDKEECQSIDRLGFLFDLYEPVTLPQARKLATGLVTDFLQQINTNQKLKPYLSSFPFTPNQVVIRVRLRTKDCGFVYPQLGNVAYLSAMDGLIIYDTINSFTYDLDTLRTETFVEALGILKAKSIPFSK